MPPRHAKPSLQPFSHDGEPPTDTPPTTNPRNSRFPRETKSIAYSNARWVGAAPKGKNLPKPVANDADNVAPSTLKRAASTVKQSARNKFQKARHTDISQDDDNVVMSDAPVPAPRKAARKRTLVIESESDESQSAPKPRPQPKPSYKNAAEDAAGEVAVEDAAFADDSEMQGGTVSDNEEEGQDGNDEQELEEDDDDLFGGREETLSRKLADATPQWQDEDDDGDDNDNVEASPPIRRRSRSASSGHLSVPDSMFGHDDDEDSDKSDHDSVLEAGLKGLKQVHERVRQSSTPPESERQIQSQAKPRRLDLRTVMATEPRGRGRAPSKLQIRRQETEIPTFNPERSISRRGNATAATAAVKPAGSKLAVAVAKPATTATQHAGASSKSSTTVPPADGDCIDIVFDAHGKIGKKAQHPDVSRTLDVGLEYYFGFHLTRHPFPDSTLRLQFAREALVNAGVLLGLEHVVTRVREDSKYREALSGVLFRRISTFRGKVKSYAVDHLYAHYRVSHGSEARVNALLREKSFIYEHKADSVDPITKAVIFGKAIYSKPFLHPSIPHIASHFFRGANAIGGRILPLLPLNANKKVEIPRAMLGMVCCAIDSALGDFATGEHKPTDFEGSAFADTYRIYLALMDAIIEKKPAQYATTMEHIFAAASNGGVASRSEGQSTSRQQQAALDAMDLSD